MTRLVPASPIDSRSARLRPRDDPGIAAEPLVERREPVGIDATEGQERRAERDHGIDLTGEHEAVQVGEVRPSAPTAATRWIPQRLGDRRPQLAIGDGTGFEHDDDLPVDPPNPGDERSRRPERVGRPERTSTGLGSDSGPPVSAGTTPVAWRTARARPPARAAPSAATSTMPASPSADRAAPALATVASGSVATMTTVAPRTAGSSRRVGTDAALP